MIRIFICALSIIHLSWNGLMDRNGQLMPDTYVSKTYLFLGNSFETVYKSKIDTLNFSWQDRFENGQLKERIYPKYQGEFLRKEVYEYYNLKELKSIHFTTSKIGFWTTQDSTIYEKLNPTATKITNYVTGEIPSIQIQRSRKDTIDTENLFSSGSFTSREIWETKFRKSRQIIYPEMDDIQNFFLYNTNGDLVQIERYERGEFKEISMSLEYSYDNENRVTSRETYYGDGKQRELGSKEIVLY